MSLFKLYIHVVLSFLYSQDLPQIEAERLQISTSIFTKSERQARRELDRRLQRYSAANAVSIVASTSSQPQAQQTQHKVMSWLRKHAESFKRKY